MTFELFHVAFSRHVLRLGGEDPSVVRDGVQHINHFSNGVQIRYVEVETVITVPIGDFSRYLKDEVSVDLALMGAVFLKQHLCNRGVVKPLA